MKVIPITPPLSSFSSDAEAYEPDGTEPIYSFSTSYALDAIVAYRKIGSPYTWGIWKSLQNSNQFRYPDSNPTWWVKIYDLVYWKSTSQYESQATPQVVWNGRVYRSLVNSNLNKQPDLYPADWEDEGTYNPTRMWNVRSNEPTTRASPLVATITPGVKTNSVACFGLNCTSVRIQASSTAGGGSIYDQTIDTEDALSGNWYNAVYGANRHDNSVVVFDVPAYADTVYTLTFTNTAGDVQVASVVVGTFVDLGDVQVGAESSMANWASVSRDLDPSISPLNLVRDIPTIRVQTTLNKASARHADLLRRDLALSPVAVWSMVDDHDPGGDPLPLLMLGFARRFQISLRPADVLVDLDLETL